MHEESKMNNFVIMASSTTDFTEDYAKKHNLTLLPFSFMLDGNSYEDNFGKSMSIDKFYETIRSGASATTSMVNSEQYMSIFTEHLEKGMDVVYIELSSAISGSAHNGQAVVEELNKKYDNQVYFVDSLCASGGFGLLVHYALMKKEEGMSAPEIKAWLEETKLKFIHWFTVDDLNHLKRGGRVSATSAFIGTMLKIKPVLNMDNKGRLIPRFKVRGRKKSLAKMVDMMVEDIENPAGQTVFIGHGDCLEDAEYVAERVRKEFADITDIRIYHVGPVIGAHSGPGTVALFYIGKERYDAKGDE